MAVPEVPPAGSYGGTNPFLPGEPGTYGSGTYGGVTAVPPPYIHGRVIPHFSLPFRFATPLAAVTEQDSLDEIADCLLAILVCPQGFRVELPAFGLPDPTFTMPAPSLDVLRAVIERWEPRAVAVLDEYPDLLDVLQAHVEVYARARTEV